MERFIRMDVRGQWKGIQHKSSFAGSALVDNEEDVKWEKGISCYKMYENDPVYAVEELYKYWTDIAMLNLNEFKDMQVTVFEGMDTDNFGSDGENLATCKNTLNEINAYDFMKVVFEAKENLDDEEIEEEIYSNIIIDLVNSL